LIDTSERLVSEFVSEDGESGKNVEDDEDEDPSGGEP